MGTWTLGSGQASQIKMNSITTVLFSLAFISSSVLGADESYHGMGSMKCYGDMSITLGGGEDEGFLDCQPAWGSPAAPPQGIIADGSDGSHWATATGWPWMTGSRPGCSVGTPPVM